MKNSQLVKDTISTIVDGLDLVEIKNALIEKLKLFPFETKIEWTDNKATIYIREDSDTNNIKMNVLEVSFNN